MKVGEFVADLLIDSSSASVSVKDLLTKFGELEVATVGEIGVLMELGLKFAHVADQAINTAISFQQFETQTGLSAQELQKWQIAAGMANVSAEEVGASVMALQKNLAAIRLGEGNISGFQLLGIGANQDAFGVLDQLRSRIRGVDAATAVNIIAKMGLGPNMLQVLRLSNEEFAKFRMTAQGMSTTQEAAFLRTQEGLVRINMRLRETGYAITASVMPSVEHLLTALSDMAANVNEFKGAWLAAAAALAVVFAPISAAIAGILLLMDDLYTYETGGKSITGLLLGRKGTEPERDKAINTGMMAAAANALPGGGMPGTGVVQSIMNTFHIQSSADPNALANAIADQIKRTVDQASLQTPSASSPAKR